MNINHQLPRLNFYGTYITLTLSILILVFGSVSAAVTTPFQGGNYYALVIGNNNYQDKQGAWRSLKNPINDAMSVVNVLRRKYAFSEGNIRLLTDATRGDIIQELNKISRQVNSKDSVLVFYAGHGYLNEETEEAYWIPVDAQGANETNYLRHKTIKDKLSIIGKKAKHVLLVSDSCYSGTLVRGVFFKPDNTKPDYYSKKAKLKSIQVIAAGGAEYVEDGYLSTGHSPFAYFFIQGLENNTNPYLSASEFVIDVEKNVANNVMQTPVMGAIFGAGDEGGEFIFTHTELTEEDIQREIEALQKSAENYFKQKHYIHPPGNNARNRWQEVLRLDTSNQIARQGLKRIAMHYVSLAKEQIKNKRFDEAKKSLKVAADVKPDYPEIKSAQELWEKKRYFVSPIIIPW